MVEEPRPRRRLQNQPRHLTTTENPKKWLVLCAFLSLFPASLIVVRFFLLLASQIGFIRRRIQVRARPWQYGNSRNFLKIPAIEDTLLPSNSARSKILWMWRRLFHRSYWIVSVSRGDMIGKKSKLSAPIWKVSKNKRQWARGDSNSWPPPCQGDVITS